MKFLNLGSTKKNLSLLVALSVLPALAILCYSGLKQRRHSIEDAKQNLTVMTHAMAQVQTNIALSTRLILSTLSLLPEIKALNLPASRAIFKDVLAKNPAYLNITLTDPKGEVLASDKPFGVANLMDRKHVREALASKDFAVGEYIVARSGARVPALAFAYPVLDNKGSPKAILTAAIRLDRFTSFHDTSTLPEKSFVAITDHKGIQLFYYPPNQTTNLIGKPISPTTWGIASTTQGPGTFIAAGSDGTRRVFAFEQVHFPPDPTPALYVWAAVPETTITAPANADMTRNLLAMFLAAGLSLAIALTITRTTIIAPITRLVALTRRFAAGYLEARSDQADLPDEFGILINSFHDMAEALTRSQRTLQENEARFRLVMDSLDAIVYVADMTTYEVLFINKYGKKVFGDATGKLCWQSLQSDQSGPCSFCTNRYLVDEDGNPEEAYTWEFQNTVTGQWFHIQDRAIRWIDDRMVRLAIATDISQRKLAETHLAEEREHLTVILQSIGDGVIATDNDGRVILVNTVAESLTGWSCEEAAGRALAEVFTLVNGETRTPCESPLSRVLASGKIINLEEQHPLLIAKNGLERTISDSGAPIRDKEGAIIGMVLVFRDITEHLRTEQELLKIKKLESIGVLAGGIAHDFNNILAAIIGNIDLSLLDATISERTRELLTQAAKASWRARDLTRQLLTFAKGGQPIKKTASLAEVVKDSADFVLRGGKVACRYSFPDDLWLVDIDTSQISQVVQNIIINASNAMPSGGIVEVACNNVSSAEALTLDFLKAGNYVKMSIHDSGVGIAPDLLDKIFDPYFSTKQQGSGLGLAITHSIISKHDGHISVESTPGVGTTFTVYLPASAQSSVTVKKREPADLSSRKSLILVMDDEEAVRNITQAFLNRMGHQVLLAQDGEEAIQIYQDAMTSGTPIDLTIMDLTIPGGMGGTEAIQQLLAIDPKAKVIVSSGYSNNPAMANFTEYGFCAALAKPYQLQDLTKVINQFLA